MYQIYTPSAIRNYESIKIVRTIVSFEYGGTVARNVDARDIRSIRSNSFGAFCLVSHPSYLTTIRNIFHGIFSSSYFTLISRVVSLRFGRDMSAICANIELLLQNNVRNFASHAFVSELKKERKVTIRLTSPLVLCA